jgi:hypothetical protein
MHSIQLLEDGSTGMEVRVGPHTVHCNPLGYPLRYCNPWQQLPQAANNAGDLLLLWQWEM